MTITQRKLSPATGPYRMKHAYIVEQLSGGEPWSYEVWFGREGARWERKDDLLWVSTNSGKALELVDQLNTGRE